MDENIYGWNNKEKLIEIIEGSKSQTEILNKLGLSNGCGNNQTLLKYVKLYNIDISHLSNVRYIKLMHRPKEKLTDVEFFIKDTSRKSSSMKKRIINGGLKENKCEECNNPPIWNNKPLVLQLDHINGDRLDNRLENLRLICPNCHTQTSTFSKGLKETKVTKQTGFDINHFEIYRKAPLLEEVIKKLEAESIKAAYKFFKMGPASFEALCNHYKIDLNKYRRGLNWPENEVLQKLVLEGPLTKVGLKLGVTDSAIKKHLKKNGLFSPASFCSGYWTKVRFGHQHQFKFEDLKLENNVYVLK